MSDWELVGLGLVLLILAAGIGMVGELIGKRFER